MDRKTGIAGLSNRERAACGRSSVDKRAANKGLIPGKGVGCEFWEK
jgi:hypothetical protein